MTNPTEPSSGVHDPEQVEMPEPTAWPLVLGLAITLLVAGVATNLALSVVGLVLFAISLAFWIVHLLPGRGHVHEPLVEPERRPRPIEGLPGTVEQLHPGMAGYRFQLPEKIHPISAGIKGGIAGGLVMPIPALLYGLISDNGIWFPINLLAGMVLPGIDRMTVEELRQFNLTALVVAVFIHAFVSVILGLIYGVMLPTLPDLPRPLAWGGVLMPLLWTGVSYGLMGLVNPVLHKGVDWPWFIFSQFIFGAAAALVVTRVKTLRPASAGVLGGAAGGLLMAVPALLWSLLSGNGIWYPVNLLAGMVQPGLGELPLTELRQFRPDWLLQAVVIHAVFSATFGLVYGLLLPKLPPIPGPLVWGGALMPLLWTAASYGLMGLLNPGLGRWVDWPWFMVSQFVFGVAAALVVVRTEQVAVPPSGPGVSPPTGPGEGPAPR